VPVPEWQNAVTMPLFCISFLHGHVSTGIIRAGAPMDQEQHKDETPVKTTVRIPQSIINELKEAGKRHRRNFNSELVVALEDYLTNWKNKH
jgi:hypothetical protein